VSSQIPQAHQEHIFNRYYRIPGATGQSIPGLGIGLYISREIIKGNGGTIAVESAEGQGSTFTISLPLQPDLHR